MRLVGEAGVGGEAGEAPLTLLQPVQRRVDPYPVPEPGQRHARAFSPSFARILARVPPAHAATVSGTGSTGALLAGVVGVAAVGSVYFAVAGGDPDRSVAGFGAASAILAVCLVAGAASAARGMRQLRTAPHGPPAGRLREERIGVRS